VLYVFLPLFASLLVIVFSFGYTILRLILKYFTFRLHPVDDIFSDWRIV